MLQIKAASGSSTCRGFGTDMPVFIGADRKQITQESLGTGFIWDESLGKGFLYRKKSSKCNVRWFSKFLVGYSEGNTEMSLPEWPQPLCSDFEGTTNVLITAYTQVHTHVMLSVLELGSH